MSVPVIHAKLRVPSLPRSYLPRPRLDRLWQEWRWKRLVLVTAGAGFGKTLFLAASAPKAGRPCIWYSLDELDADPASFFAHLAAATRSLLPAQLRIDAVGAGFGRSFLAVLIHAFRDSDSGIVLVLDDLQVIGESPEILEFLASLVRFLPEGSTIVFASREPVGIPVAKLRAQGALATLGARDLQFTEEEVEQLFHQRFPGVELEPGLSRRIVAETEGWAAGTEILFQLSGGSSSWAIREALDQLSTVGSSWFSYFAEEVVGRLEPELRDFLYRSSVLPRLDADLCDRVLGLRNSRVLLEELTRRNLFTFPTGTGGNSYRYHHLFREFLRDQLERVAGATEARRLQLCAGRELERAGAWAEAAAAYAGGGDPRATLEVIEKHGEELLLTGQYRLLRKVFETIPDEQFAGRAVALSVLGRLEEIQGRWQGAHATYQRGLTVSKAGRRRAELLALLAQLHLRRGEYATCVSLCKEALDEPGRKAPALRGRILELLGVAAAESGKLDEAEDRLGEALSIFRKSGNESGEGRALFLLAINVYYFRGDFGTATDAARKALVIFQRRGDHRRIGHTLGILGFLSMETGREHEARDLTERALRLAESLEYRMVQGYCHYTLGKCALLRREPSEARRHFELARSLGEELREPALLTFPRMGLAEVALGEGNRHGARALAAEALEIAGGRNDRFKEAQCCVLLGLAEDRSHRRRAATLWRRAETIFRAMGARFELHRLLLIRLAAETVPKKETVSVLEELLIGAARSGHEVLLLDLEPDRAAKVLAQAVRRMIEVDYAIPLLVKLGPRVVPHLAPLIEDRSDEVRERAVELLVLVGGGEARRALSRAANSTTEAGRAALEAVGELKRVPLVPLRIQALGPFILTVGDTVLPFDGWRSTRALRLFHLLLVHRFRWLPKDIVLETLWPEVEPEKAENNLRQSVLLLRRTLEPELKETRLSRYLRFRNDAYRLDPGGGYVYDGEEFEKASTCPAATGGAARRRGEETRLRAAIDLYRGSFLEECPYEEFLTTERERLRDRFLGVLGRLSSLYASSRRWEDCIPLSRRGIAEDPYGEGFYESLIRAHLSLRHRREALNAYHQYEQMMTRDLGLPPSARMRSLADQAVALGRGRTKVSPGS